MRTVAVDWSGAASRAARSIWLAEVRNGRLVRLECGRGRQALTRHLLELAREDPDVIVGLDFAFSFPAWFLRDRDLPDAPALWQCVANHGERWLAEPEPPFWSVSKGQSPPPVDGPRFRRTDRAVGSIGGHSPKSVFQVTGPGSVGTASIRGMPFLFQLRRGGFSVWPLDPPEPPLVVEIYPRALTGPVVKKDEDVRRTYLAERFPELNADVRDRMASSDHAFDAGVSALVMERHREKILALEPAAKGDEARLEGEIWLPATLTGVHRTEEGPPELEEDSEKLGAFPDRGPATDRAAEREALLSAVAFAIERHQGQSRKGDEESPYITHPVEVARLLAAAGADPQTVRAGILHDTVEDTDTDPEELEARFGSDVRRLVEEVTDDKSLPKVERKRRQVEQAPRLSCAAKRIKLADKIANITDVTHRPPAGWSLKRRREYLDWSATVVDSCRGASPSLEAIFDQRLEEARDALSRVDGESYVEISTVARLWTSEREEDWNRALHHYWRILKPEQMAIERAMADLNRERVRRMDGKTWYRFLHDEYFVWKYTAKNRLATTRKALRKHEAEGLESLLRIKEDLFSFDRRDARAGLLIATRVRGLGPAGASGLLAVLFPEDFATIDQFVVKALRQVPDIPDRERIERMNPEGLTVGDAALLIEVLRTRAAELNESFGTESWTPRRVDMVLWAVGR